jgi:hypothetical protein
VVYKNPFGDGYFGTNISFYYSNFGKEKKKQRENPGVLRNSAKPHIYYRKLLGEHGRGMFRNTVYT